MAKLQHMKVNDLIFQLFAGGLLGMFGQVIRVFIGLSKSRQNDSEFDAARLLGSLAVGFTAGGIGIITITKWQPDPLITYQDFMLLLSIGYAGTDFLEGIYRSMISRSGSNNDDAQAILPRLTDLETKVQQAGTPRQPAGSTLPTMAKEAFVFANDSATLVYGPNADSAAISKYVEGVIKDILSRSGNPSATITSTKRTPESQANAMFVNLRNKGVASQRALYGPAGDLIIDVYESSLHNGLSDAQIIHAMADKIRAIGPGKLSKHLGDFSVLAVVDIAPSSIRDKDAFREAVEFEKSNGRVSKAITNLKNDPAFHLEIPNRETVVAEHLNSMVLHDPHV